MELETDMRKKVQLDNVMEHARYCTIPMGEDCELRWKGEARESCWTGVADPRSDGVYPDEQVDEGFDDDNVHDEIAGSTPVAHGQDSASSTSGGVEDQADGAGQPSGSVIAVGEEDVTPSVAEILMRKYFVITMSWDVRKTTV
jgi:hypothetical protein